MSAVRGEALLGVDLEPRPLAEVRRHASAAIAREAGQFTFACANPHSLATAIDDEPFRNALRQTSCVVADGIGCLVGARLAGARVGPRITGFDFFRAVMEDMDRASGRVFFFGSSEHVLDLVRSRCRKDYPLVAIDTLSPPYGEWTDAVNAGIVQRINAARPDVLWIAMTAPKQEKWMAANLSALKVPVIGCIGAVFDYYAGTVRRAPPWVCRIGLEWAYRLAFEPKRLWRRTFVSGPVFLWACLMQRFGS